MRKYLWYVIRVVVLALVYLAVAELSELTMVAGDQATLIWPGAGIAIMALYVYGYKLWPGITIGVLLSTAVDSQPLLSTGLLVAVGATVGAITSVYLLKRVRFDREMTRIKDVTKFLVLAGLIAPTISATIGVYGLMVGGLISPDQYLYTWSTWWIGDALGIVAYGPFLLIWDKQSIKKLVSIRRRNISTFMIIVFGTLVAMSFVIFDLMPLSHEGINPYKFLIVPLFPVVALYFGQRGNVTATAISLTIAIIFTIARYTPEQSHYLSLGILQLAVATLSISFMYITAAIAERDAHQRVLTRRAIELDEKRAYYQQLSHAKDEFISIASHQLRSPATGVKMHLGMLKTGLLGTISDEQLASIEAAYDTNERLIMTIENLLTTAEVDAGGMSVIREKTDINQLLLSIVEGMKPVLLGRGQTIEFDHTPGDYVKNIDIKKLTIAIENLIENASKYSYEDTTVHVGLTKKQGKIVITIRDEGIGIDKKNTRKLFDKFTRIPNEFTSTRSGNGLGLYLVKQIITAHAGHIAVVSELGVGTTFTIRL